MLTTGLSVTEVSVERSFDGAVGSRGTRVAQLTGLTAVHFTGDADELGAAVQRDVTAVTPVLYPLCRNSSKSGVYFGSEPLKSRGVARNLPLGNKTESLWDGSLPAGAGALQSPGGGLGEKFQKLKTYKLMLITMCIERAGA